MNIAFLLTPKSDIVTLKESMTLSQAMEKMESFKYSAVPVIDKEGRYIYSLSEGDILWHLKDLRDFNFKKTDQVAVNQIKRSRKIKAISINERIERVLDMIKFQNFVPVVDDAGIFIGIVTRSDIMVSNFYNRHEIKVKNPMFDFAGV